MQSGANLVPFAKLAYSLTVKLPKNIFFFLHVLPAFFLFAVGFLRFSLFFFFCLIMIFYFWRSFNFECEIKYVNKFFLETSCSLKYNYFWNLFCTVFCEIFFRGSTVNVKMRSIEVFFSNFELLEQSEWLNKIFLQICLLTFFLCLLLRWKAFEEFSVLWKISHSWNRLELFTKQHNNLWEPRVKFFYLKRSL